MSGKVKCTCGWSWNKSDSSKKDMYICHQCGKDNTMKDGGWLNKFQDGGEEEKIYGTYNLPEVVVTPEPEEKGFWKQSIRSYLGENKDAGFLGALGSVVTYPLGLPQQAMMYGLTGKVQKPSESLGINNRLGALVTDIIADPTNLLGVGIADDALKLSSKVGKFLKEETALKNAYKANPWAEKLKNPNSSYRVAGLDAAEDFKNTGVLRSRNTEPGQLVEGTKFVLPPRPTAFPSFQKGYADLNYLPENGGVVFKTDLPTFKRGDINPVTGREIKGRHYAHRVIDPKTGATVTNIPGADVKMYNSGPHWLKGYKEVPKPNQVNSPIDTGFNSEINWGNWNKEITENPQLMKEYNAIEETSKANGSWMKNPDGSAFQGTPEQFVQQNSNNFKKAFPNYYGEVLNHNSPNKFSQFSDEFFGTSSDKGWYGSGVYTHPDKNYTKMYGKNNYELYANSPNKGFLDESNIDDAEFFKRKNEDIENYLKPYYDINVKHYNLQPDRYVEDALDIYNKKFLEDIKKGKLSRDKLDLFTTLTNPQNGEVVIPFNNPIKSAVGNSGMFDMTNPNIYKALFPGVAGAAALQEKKNGGWLNKFDVPEAQNGIEGTMGGLTDQGFNYNGAWGGTMAMGGSLPGAVGFTYARTQGSAPANGKYTKKTKASAQNGEEMKFYQEGLDWKPKSISRDGGWLSKFEDGGKKSKKLLQPEIQYMENYLESPMYLERLAKMAGTEKQLQDDSYGKFKAEQFSQSNVTDPLKDIAFKQGERSKEALDYIKDNISIGDYDLGRGVAGVYDSGVKDIRLRKDLFAQNPTVGIHELSHATLTGREPYTKDFQEKYLDPIFLNPGSVGWEPIVQKPTEVKARLDSIRYLANKKGLYNPGKEKFTEKHLQLLEKDPEISKDFNYKQLKDQLKKGTKKTGFIWMMNNIAKLQDEESNSLPFAKDGKVITDPNGQWAHPGEITRIPSNQITMQGVPYPVMGISDTGDTHMMYPDQEYSYEGKSVTEYPIMKNGGWLNKYK